MLRSAKEMLGYNIHATDGKLGKVKDFYFDDLRWTVRYVVVDTGNWLPGRLVLISLLSVGVGKPDWSRQILPVNLSKEQVEDGPSASADKPVSRQHEAELRRYYGWPAYYPALPQAGAHMEMGAAAAYEKDKKEEGDPHLRSVKEVKGYHIEATDGQIGHVEDFVIDTGNWAIRYMVVDTRNWLPGRKVLVALEWVSAVKWHEKAVHLELSQEEIRKSPEFDPSQPVNREYESRLYDYYGRPSYW